MYDRNKVRRFTFVFSQRDAEVREWFEKKADKSKYIKDLILADKMIHEDPSQKLIFADHIPFIESEEGVLNDFAYRCDIKKLPAVPVVPAALYTQTRFELTQALTQLSVYTHTVTQPHKRAEQNPLSWEELQLMDGQPVWLTLLHPSLTKKSGWGLFYKRKGAIMQDWTIFTFWHHEYGTSWLAYASKPAPAS